jgi:hypothetical protein
MTTILRLLTSLILGMLFSCNPTRVIQPIPKGQLQVGANVGGAIIEYGNAAIPLPLTSIYSAYGLNNNTTGFASVHTTALLFGVLQTDLGITHQLLAPNKWIPGISVSPIANIMFDTWEHHFRLYPQLDANVYWNYGVKPNLVYCSLNNWFELQSTKAHDEPQTTHWLPSIGFGQQWNRLKYGLQLEVKYIAPNQSNKNIVVDYVGIHSKGALGFYIGFHRKF